MKKIYSKINSELLLHVIIQKQDFKEGSRVNVSDDQTFLQLAIMNHNSGKTFKPHYHLECDKKQTITQESWVVVQGKVKAILYDIDQTILSEEILNQGEASITFYGGHNYEFLEDNSLVYEYKTGPYFGAEQDKVRF